VVIDDVLVGEVWICSGQSNMAFTLDRAATAAQDLPDADYAGIRLFQVKERSVLQPLETTPDAAWRQLTPESVRGFSAVGYLFARRLHKELGVPVGMIQSSWSGTAAELWTSHAALARSPELQRLLKVWDSADDRTHALAARPADFQLDFDGFELMRANGSAEPIHLDWSFNWDSARNSHFELIQSGRAGRGFAARLSGGLEADESPVLTSGFAPHRAPLDLSQYAALRFYCRGRGAYRFDVLEPAVRDADEFNIPAIPATADWQAVTIRFADLKQAGWGVKQSLTPNALSGFRILPLRAAGSVQLPPASLFNGMVAPLAPYAMRGVIWYQG
jgi:sialate O-acetylesterase